MAWNNTTTQTSISSPASFVENDRMLNDLTESNGTIVPLVKDLDDDSGDHYTADHMVRPGNNTDMPAALPEDATDYDMPNTPATQVTINNHYQIWAREAKLPLTSAGNALPGGVGSITAQEMYIGIEFSNDLNKAMGSNIASKDGAAGSGAGTKRAGGVMTFGTAAGAYNSIGDGNAAAITNAGYDFSTGLTASVNDVASDTGSKRGEITVDDVQNMAYKMWFQLSGYTTAPSGGTLGGTDIILALPGDTHSKMIVGGSQRLASLGRYDLKEVSKGAREGETEGRIVETNASIIHTGQGRVALCPLREQVSDTTDDTDPAATYVGKIGFMVLAEATGVAYKQRVRPKDVDVDIRYNAAAGSAIFTFCGPPAEAVILVPHLVQ